MNPPEIESELFEATVVRGSWQWSWRNLDAPRVVWDQIVVSGDQNIKGKTGHFGSAGQRNCVMSAERRKKECCGAEGAR